MSAPSTVPLVEVRNLVKHFPIKGGVLQRTVAQVQAVDDVSFDIRRGETLGLVGESGCGKTTVGRLLLRLIDPTSGTIHFDGEDITRIKGAKLKRYRRRMQIIFQDPYSSLDPRTPIADSIGEGLRIHGLGDARERGRKVARMMDLVGLQPYHARRYPHEFSGGQRQRIGIARALVLEPDLVVCDEPVSALDVSIQAQVLNLLRELQGELGLTYLFVAHNMGVVEHISDRVAVMYLGKVMEVADRREMFRDPEHPYSAGADVGDPHPEPGAPPSAGHPPWRRPEPRQSAARLSLPPALPVAPGARRSGDLRDAGAAAHRPGRRRARPRARLCVPFPRPGRCCGDGGGRNPARGARRGGLISAGVASSRPGRGPDPCHRQHRRRCPFRRWRRRRRSP